MKTVLIADDNRHIRLLVAAALRSTGHRLLEAKDGEEALEVALVETPDLVLLDVHMPKLDGFEVLHFLKKRPETAGARVVMLTTAATPAEMKRGEDEGADGYVVKPFSAEDLRETVASVLALDESETAG